jgi:hypothetical protein
MLETSRTTGNLVLSSKGLEAIPVQIFLLQTLTSLDLSSNVLFDLSKDIGRLENLTSIDLKWNRISSLPRALGSLRQLTLLDLSYNELTVLPGEMGELLALRSLRLNDNSLREIPKELGNLKGLVELHLQYNKLQLLPLELCRLTKLSTLELSGNALESPPPHVVSGGIPSVLSHLHSLYQLSCKIPTIPGRVVAPGRGTSHMDEEHVLEDEEDTALTSAVELGLPPKVPSGRNNGTRVSTGVRPGTSGARPFTAGVGSVSRPSTSQIGDRVVVTIGPYRINAQDEEDASRCVSCSLPLSSV